MIKYTHYLFSKYKKLFKDNYFRQSVLIGTLAVILAGVATSFAKGYVNQAASNPLGDLLLDNLPTLPFFGFLIWGMLAIAFSIHVALPFLAALIFWNFRWFRFYLLLAVFASASAVILAKSHYSIDVFAAPFITYSIFVISRYFFKKDFGYITKNDLT